MKAHELLAENDDGIVELRVEIGKENWDIPDVFESLIEEYLGGNNYHSKSERAYFDMSLEKYRELGGSIGAVQEELIQLVDAEDMSDYFEGTEDSVLTSVVADTDNPELVKKLQDRLAKQSNTKRLGGIELSKAGSPNKHFRELMRLLGR